MSTAERILRATSEPSRLQAAFSMLATEALNLIAALLQPGKVLGQVEQMGKLLVAANALGERDPQRAQLLRRRAAAIRVN